MIKIRVPATSANLGPGFDCLGIALGLFNEYEAEPADEMRLDEVEERFDNEENLFVKAFRAAGGTGNLHVTFDCSIPVSRGLGSSAALITGGALAAQVMNHSVNADELFHITAALEGHPDNAAPAVYGGLTASLSGFSGYRAARLPVNETLRFTVLVPDIEMRTEEERAILPESYPRESAVSNVAHAVMMCEALKTGDISLLRDAAHDLLHEPSRKLLIPSFDIVKEICEADTGGALVISGSGSSCLLISDHPLSDRAALSVMTLPEHWAVMELPVSSGPEYMENGVWQAII